MFWNIKFSLHYFFYNCSIFLLIIYSGIDLAIFRISNLADGLVSTWINYLLDIQYLSEKKLNKLKIV